MAGVCMNGVLEVMWVPAAPSPPPPSPSPSLHISARVRLNALSMQACFLLSPSPPFLYPYHPCSFQAYDMGLLPNDVCTMCAAMLPGRRCRWEESPLLFCLL